MRINNIAFKERIRKLTGRREMGGNGYRIRKKYISLPSLEFKFVSKGYYTRVAVLIPFLRLLFFFFFNFSELLRWFWPSIKHIFVKQEGEGGGS